MAGLFALVAATLRWLQLQVIEPIVRWWEEVVLGSWEEWLLALVRQGFEETTRFLNALGAWFLSLFSKSSYREQLRRSWQQNSWQQWWCEAAARPSTLNALVATLVEQQQDTRTPGYGPFDQHPPASQAHAGRPSGASCPPAPGASLHGQPIHCSSAISANGQLLARGSQSEAVQVAGSGSWWALKPQRGRAAANGRPLHQRQALLPPPSDPHAAAARGRGRDGLASLPQRPAVFVQQSGMGILDELSKRRQGLMEDAKLAAQLAVSNAFEAARGALRAVLLLPSREALLGHLEDDPAQHDQQHDANHHHAAAPEGPGSSPERRSALRHGAALGRAGRSGPPRGTLPRSKSAHVSIVDLKQRPGAAPTASAAGSTSAVSSSVMTRRGLARSRSYGKLYSATASSYHQAAATPSDVLSVIRAAGYPFELHTVTTADGYVLRLERIPRPGARDVVFFMHGVLDTSMAWVSGGVTGSQAFAAWEAGLDVWLGNSRGNAPRQHQDPARRGWRYWAYNINHMGMNDIAAQLDHIHNVKCAELGAGTVTLDLDHLGPLADTYFGQGSVGMRGLGGGSVAGLGCEAGSGGQAGSGGGRAMGHASSKLRMRPSNSDGNLHRWSSNLAAEPAPLSAAAAAAAAAVRDAAPGDTVTGATCEPVAVASPTQANGNGGAEPQYQGLGPAQEGSGMGLEVAVEGAPGQRPPLGGPHSSLGLSTPLLSCDPSTAGSSLSMATAEAEEGQQGQGSPKQAKAEDVEHVAEGAACLGPAHASLPAGVGGAPTPQGGQRRGRVPVAHQQSEPLLQSGVAASAVLPCVPDGAPLRKVVTLRVPQDEQGGPEVATTFTLAAKTRTDFGPHPNTPPSTATSSSLATVSAPHPALDSVDAPSSSSSAGSSGTAAWAAHGLLGGILGRRRSLDAGRAAPGSPVRDSAEAPTPAATSHTGVFEAMGSVLGPAAGAVTLAVASAATTAGAALATAAATASHLLQPSPSPARQSVAPPPSPTRNATSASPFARAAKEAGCAAIPPGAVPAAHCPGRAAAPTAAIAPVGPPRSPAATLPRRASSSDLLPGARSGCTLPFPLIPAPSASGAAASRSVSSASSLAALTPAPGSAAPAMDRAASGASSGATSSIGTPSTAAGPVLPPHCCQVLGSTSSGLMAAQQAAAPFPQPPVDPSGRCWQPPAPTAPYKLRCVAHSLGGMSVLVHLVNRLREGRPHNVSRLLLLTPAGFHKYCPRAARPIMWALPIVTRLVRLALGRDFCFPLYIPTVLGRAITIGTALSALRIPGLGELLRLLLRTLFDGDISQWDRALQMPHYSALDMPAISVDQVLHLIQLVNTGRFQLFDYGSRAANMAHYGSPSPPDVSSEYWRLDLPVHLVAGRRDGIIPPANIRRHLEAMRSQGVAVSYREYDFGHLDFTFGVKEELRMYLMKMLRL